MIKLTKTELKVLNILTSTGHCNRIIGQELGIGEKQVQRHLCHIYKKMDVKNRAELIIRSKA